ncbi:MAG TPA: hypothetical protein VFM05_08565, partial [Candidatus Saccharimonadales bacterium]|nr:hypothetical protein [Candidatus Saccharimonadales bacterium]
VDLLFSDPASVGDEEVDVDLLFSDPDLPVPPERKQSGKVLTGLTARILVGVALTVGLYYLIPTLGGELSVSLHNIIDEFLVQVTSIVYSFRINT